MHGGKREGAGRPLGVLNRTTSVVRERIEKVLNEHFNDTKLAADLRNVESYDRLKIFIRLLEFVVPKMRSQEIKMDFESFTDQQLDEIISGLLKASENESEE